MFDLSFTEILVIGVVALVVLGPERLPEVARTFGRWLAKAQGYMTQMKSEFSRETQLAEIQKLREEIASSANVLKSTVTQAQETLTREAQEVNTALHESDASASDPYTRFNQSEATMASAKEPYESAGAVTTLSSTSSFRTNNPFGWDLGESDTSTSYRSLYVPRRYKPTASLDDVIAELEELRREMALPRKMLGGYNRRYAPRSRVNRPRIYR